MPWFRKRRFTAEDIVKSAYSALLGRSPDPEGLAHHVEALTRGADIAKTLEAFVNSEEARVRGVLSRRFEAHTPVCTLIDNGRLRLWVDLSDAFVSFGVLCGQYEPQETDFIVSRLRPGDTFIDIGANLGWYTILAADRVGPRGHVFAFEPRAESADLLTRSIEDNGFADRCTVIRAALGDRAGSARLQSGGSSNPGGSYLLPGDHPASDDTTEVVEVVTLDSVMSDVRCGLIKMDVEGAEPMVLRGAGDFLRRCRPIILSEVLPVGIARISHLDIEAYVELAHGLGYGLYAMEDFADRREAQVSVLRSVEIMTAVLAPLGRP